MITESELVSCLDRHWGLTGVQVTVHNGGMGWAVQANYFAWRISVNNLTGITGPQENEKD